MDRGRDKGSQVVTSLNVQTVFESDRHSEGHRVVHAPLLLVVRTVKQMCSVIRYVVDTDSTSHLELLILYIVLLNRFLLSFA